MKNKGGPGGTILSAKLELPHNELARSKAKKIGHPVLSQRLEVIPGSVINTANKKA